MSTKREDLVLIAKVIGSAAKENKKTNDSYMLTQFRGVAMEGLFSAFSQGLEHTVFGERYWSKIKTGALAGEWIMTISDCKSNLEIAKIDPCTIKDIAVAIKKEGLIEVTVQVEHDITGLQPAITAAVSATVSLSLEKKRNNIELTDDVK